MPELAGLINVQVRQNPTLDVILFNLDLASATSLGVPVHAEWQPPSRMRHAILSAADLAEIAGYFAERRQSLNAAARSELVVSSHHTKSERDLVMARSQLIVVRAIQIGWPLEEMLGEHDIRLVYRPYKWSGELLRLVSMGLLDLAIYNREWSREARQAAGDKLAILSDVGASMRGRHLYLLGRNRSLFGASEAEIVRQLRGRSLAVPVSSDIFPNVKMLLGIDDSWLDENKVRIVDIPADAGVSEILAASADFVTGGAEHKI